MAPLALEAPLLMRDRVQSARRVLVKIGTNALTQATGRFNRNHFDRLCEDLRWVAQGRELVVVSSGAVALGVEALQLASRPRDIPGKQACAAVGQSRLMRAYEDAFAAQGLVVAQLLLTHEDVQDRRRYLNARHTLKRLLAARVVPIINENDTVSVDELKFGDNDTLAGLVAGLVDPDLVVILSDVEGLYDSDPRGNPRAALIAEVQGVTAALLDACGGSVSGFGTGGMATKVRAAERVNELGIPCVIASGQTPGKLRDVLEGKPVGTLFLPEPTKRNARAAWIAHALFPKGKIWVDDGARKAVGELKRSLLPSGIQRVEGLFYTGDPVDLVAADGTPFARGLVSYGSEELARIAGRKSSDIDAVLGYHGLDEAVHRDDLVVL